MMHLHLTKEFREICRKIVSQGKTVEQWSEVESDDMFQTDNFTGGFDATEEEFCFETEIEGDEYWFQFSLEEALKITDGEDVQIEIRVAE